MLCFHLHIRLFFFTKTNNESKEYKAFSTYQKQTKSACNNINSARIIPEIELQITVNNQTNWSVEMSLLHMNNLPELIYRKIQIQAKRESKHVPQP
jgi:hypothetical protein